MTLVVKALLALLLLAIGGLAMAYGLAARAERQSGVAFPPEGQIIEVRGQKIHVVVRGDGPDVVLIHGASSNVRDFTFAFMDRLTDRFRVIALDRPGFGFSEASPPDGDTLADQARILSEAAVQLGAERPIVLGHSYGGAVAMAWALEHPDRLSALVIESGATMVWPGGIDRIYEILGTPLGRWVVAPVAAAILKADYVNNAIAQTFAPGTPPEGLADHIGGPLALRRETILINAHQRIDLYHQIEAQSARYDEITVPVEVLHGDADSTVSLDIHARGITAILPDATLTVLPGIGHNPHNAVPGDVEAAIDRAALRAGLR